MTDVAEKFMVAALIAVLSAAAYSKFSDVGSDQVGMIWNYVTSLV
jgi:hypothetical protein